VLPSAGIFLAVCALQRAFPLMRFFNSNPSMQQELRSVCGFLFLYIIFIMCNPGIWLELGNDILFYFKALFCESSL